MDISHELLISLVNALLNDLREDRAALAKVVRLALAEETITDDAGDRVSCLCSSIAPKLEFIKAAENTGCLPRMSRQGAELIDFWTKLLTTVTEGKANAN
jgi:hypothetical protein